MAKALRIITFFTVIVVVISRPEITNGIFTFLFAGIVPGTQYELPFWAMCVTLCIIGYVAIKWLQRETLYIGDETYHMKQRKAAARTLVTRSKLPTKRAKRPVIRFAKLRRRLTTAS